MLNSYTLKFTTGRREIQLPGQGVTIFVGSNNSGKSLTLRELETALSQNGPIDHLKIVKDFEIDWLSQEDLDQALERLRKKAPPGQLADTITIGRFNPSGHLEAVSLNREALRGFNMTRSNKPWMASQFYRYFMIRLDGRTRFQLTDDRSQGDLLQPPQNVLAHLFCDDDLRASLRKLIFDAFGLYFVIDPLSGGNLRMRLSNRPPLDDEQSLNSDARKFHSEATYIKEASDGVQAYVGVLSATVSGDYKLICVDEPEAFLHPPLARKLGSQLTTLATGRSGSLFASTHSADFLMGCIQASNEVRVVRLEYSNGQSKGNVVDPVLLKKLFKNPLIRSANVISALFYDGVVVTESDNDRAFYSEVFRRLAEINNDFPSVLFVNAQNKQTIKDIVNPLRQFGIPAAAIPDIDILKDGGKVWSDWLEAAHIPAALHSGYANQRDAVKKCFDAAGKDMKKDGGVNALGDDDKAAANQLFDILSEYGVFVVRIGELENWLPHVGAVGKKTDWVISILEKMGSDSSDQGYVHPGKDDVWDFMGKIVSWIRNTSRKGTL